MIRIVRNIISLIQEWLHSDPFTHSAAVAYYTLFSFPALLIILISISSLFIEGGQLETQIHDYLSTILGADNAEKIEDTIAQSKLSKSGDGMLAIGGALLLFASLRLFMQLQKALNHIWRVNAESISFKTLVARRLISFAVLIAIAFTLLVSLLLTTILTGLQEWITQHVTEATLGLFYLLHIGFSFATITFLFTLMLKLLPDIHVRWVSALRGAGVAALLFLLGEYALGIYFETFTPQSSYGVAGGFILLMLWVFYSSLILFFGAAISRHHQQSL